MKEILGVLIAVCVAGCLAEQCTVDSDCTTTTCGGTGSSVLCQHPDGAGVTTGGGLCTCSSAVQCTVASDCYDDAVSLTCPNNQRHCYDSSCICSRFPITG